MLDIKAPSPAQCEAIIVEAETVRASVTLLFRALSVSAGGGDGRLSRQLLGRRHCVHFRGARAACSDRLVAAVIAPSARFRRARIAPIKPVWPDTLSRCSHYLLSILFKHILLVDY